MNTTSEASSLRAALLACADPEYQAGSLRVGPTAQKVYGVRTPDIKAIAREWQLMHKDIGDVELLDVVETLWSGESRDERLLALAILERYRQRLGALLTWDQIDRWRQEIDNWIICDYMGTKILPPYVLAAPEERLSYLDLLITDEDVWSRRLSLVTTVPMNRDKRYALPEHTFVLLDQVKQERHPMITKAISWTLRELSKTHPDLVADYLEANGDVLASHVQREVSNKLTTGLKSGKGK